MADNEAHTAGWYTRADSFEWDIVEGYIICIIKSVIEVLHIHVGVVGAPHIGDVDVQLVLTLKRNS